MDNRLLATLPSALLLLACSAAPPPRRVEVLAPPPAQPAAQTVATSTSPLTTPTPAPSSILADPPRDRGAAHEPASPRNHGSVVVIDPGGDTAAADSLATTARSERLRRLESDRPAVLTITDKNLAQHATGELTYAAEKPPADSADKGSLEPGGHPEGWWRNGIRELRQHWRDSVELILELEKSASALRDRYYAEADPWLRDSQVKPEWDRTLDRIVEARQEAAIAEREVTAFLTRASEEGALPGWLREGNDLEPVDRPYTPADGDSPAVGEPDDLDVIGEPRTVG